MAKKPGGKFWKSRMLHLLWNQIIGQGAALWKKESYNGEIMHNNL